jgi:hypothetical protein
VAVLTRQRETLIGIVTMVTLPLTFLSLALMQQSLLPGWIRWIATFNPVNWAAEAGRSAAAPNADWGLIATRAGFSPCSCSTGMMVRAERGARPRPLRRRSTSSRCPLSPLVAEPGERG